MIIFIPLLTLMTVSGGSHDDSNLPRSNASLPRSSTFSPPRSSPFSLAKFEDCQMTENISGVVVAGIKIGEAHLEDTAFDHHSTEDLSGDVQFQEQGTFQPSEMVSTGASHRDATGD